MSPYRQAADRPPAEKPSFGHRLAHKFGRNTGTVTTWFEGDVIMVGFLCAGCGKVSGAQPAHSRTPAFMKWNP